MMILFHDTPFTLSYCLLYSLSLCFVCHWNICKKNPTSFTQIVLCACSTFKENTLICYQHTAYIYWFIGVILNFCLFCLIRSNVFVRFPWRSHWHHYKLMPRHEKRYNYASFLFYKCLPSMKYRNTQFMHEQYVVIDLKYLFVQISQLSIMNCLRFSKQKIMAWHMGLHVTL